MQATLGCRNAAGGGGRSGGGDTLGAGAATLPPRTIPQHSGAHTRTHILPRTRVRHVWQALALALQLLLQRRQARLDPLELLLERPPPLNQRGAALRLHLALRQRWRQRHK